MFVAGSILPALGQANYPAQVLQLSDDDGSALLLKGSVFHTSPGAIADRHVHTFPRSSAFMVTWRDSGDGQGTSRFAISRSGERIDQVASTQNRVRLRYAEFDPKAGEPLIPAGLKAQAGNELFLVQFVGTPLEEMRESIRALGGVVERFITDNTHIVRMPPGVRDRVAALSYVRWVGEFHPAYRLDSATLANLVTVPVRGGAGSSGRITYSIECMRSDGSQQQALARFIDSFGGIVERTPPRTRRMEASLTLEQVLEVVRRNEVAYLEPRGAPGMDMVLARQIGGAVPLLSGLGFTGQGVRGEVVDSGIDMNNPEWNGQLPLLHGAVDPEGLSHGTNCYGINFATGVIPQLTGMLPSREQGVFGHWRLFLSTAPHQYSRVTYDLESVDPMGPYRVVFQSNSWGEANTTDYNTFSAERDDAIFQAQLLVTQAQGNTNSRSARPEAWAKNVVAVGGIQHNDSLNRATHARSGASIGPAADLRTKPDLVHFYDNIHTVYSPSFGGTSAATPITAGHFGLLFQMWHEGVFSGWGGGSSVFASRPHYALAKAIAIAAAYRYESIVNTSSFEEVRNIQGWGMIDLGRIYSMRDRFFFVNGDQLVSNAQTLSFPVHVGLGEQELLISMIWNDPPGTPIAAQARVNDLDLKVSSPSGLVFWGNHGLRTSNESQPGGWANTIDTAENVFLRNPEAGTWTVEVVGSQIVEDAVLTEPGVQANFGLAVFGAVGGPPPPLLMHFPDGLPLPLAPGQPHQVLVNIRAAAQNIQTGSPAVHFRSSGTGSFTSLPLVHLGGDEYAATLPGFSCGAIPQVFFSAQGDLGAQVLLPRDAPSQVFSTQVGSMVTVPILQTTFESAWPAGWSATGLWNVSSSCAPGGDPCAQSPHAYFGRIATCNYSLPGVPSSGILTAPMVALPPVPPNGGILLKFCYALETENHPSLDKAELFVNGITSPEWRLADVLPTPTQPNRYWAQQELDLTAFAGTEVSLSWRFHTVNGSSNAFRGWHLDDVRLEATLVGCPQSCYPNCDNSTVAPILNVGDFSCFLQKFAAGDPYANCDGSTVPPVLNVADFTCFLQKFAAGCP